MRMMGFHSDQYHCYQEAYGDAHAPRWYPGVERLELQETGDMVLYRVYSDRQSQSNHIDLEVNMRVRFPQGITQTIVCYRGLLGSQRLTGLTWLPCDIVEDYQERGILIAMRIPTREHFARETQSFGEGWGNI